MLATVRCLKNRRSKKIIEYSLLEMSMRWWNTLDAAEDRNRAAPTSGRVDVDVVFPPLHLCSSADDEEGFIKASREAERRAGWLPVRRKHDKRTFSNILTITFDEGPCCRKEEGRGTGKETATFATKIGIRLLASIMAETFAAAMDAASRSGASRVDGSESNNRVTTARSKREERKSAVDDEADNVSITPNPKQISSELRPNV
jgi:hypothetical protein